MSLYWVVRLVCTGPKRDRYTKPIGAGCWERGEGEEEVHWSSQSLLRASMKQQKWRWWWWWQKLAASFPKTCNVTRGERERREFGRRAKVQYSSAAAATSSFSFSSFSSSPLLWLRASSIRRPAQFVRFCPICIDPSLNQYIGSDKHFKSWIKLKLRHMN